MGFELHFSRSGLQLAQSDEPQELSRCLYNRFGIVVESSQLLDRVDFLSGHFDGNAHGSVSQSRRAQIDLS